VNRILVTTPAFERALERYISTARAEKAVETTLTRLANDAFDPRLRTHKLKGDLAGRWAASAGYDLRIIFRLEKHQGSDAVVLLAVGAHDDVY
jgi:mRNA-degrading endonuclease YafQ of YafQ-DinJ toxin-antitoxin module